MTGWNLYLIFCTYRTVGVMVLLHFVAVLGDSLGCTACDPESQKKLCSFCRTLLNAL